MRMICIRDPTIYPLGNAETPDVYRALSADNRIELFHVDCRWIHDESTTMRMFRVPNAVCYEEFLKLSDKAAQPHDLADFEVALCRTLKPFPAGHMTRLCELESRISFVNSPEGIRRHLQPGFLPRIAAGLTPEMIISRDLSEALVFLNKFGKIVCKRSASCGDNGVYKVWREHGQFLTDNVVDGTTQHNSADEALNHVFSVDRGDFQLVRFLKNIDQGDKRILVTAEKVIGAYL